MTPMKGIVRVAARKRLHPVMLVSSIRCAQQAAEPETLSKREQRRRQKDSGEIITEESKASVPKAADFNPTIIAENVPRWKTENANPELIGNFYQVIPSLDKFRGQAFTMDPANHKLPQSSIMLRESTLKVMKNVMDEILKGNSGRKIVLAFNWIAGKEFYSKTESGTFIQPKLTASVLKLFLDMNTDILAKICGIWNQQCGIITRSVKAVLGELLDNAGSRPPFIIAVDQLNALFTKTAYHDTDSTILLSDRFELINAFQERNRLTDPVIKSPFLDLLLSSDKKGMNAKFEDISDVDAFGVLLPRGIAKADGTGKVNKSLVERVWILTGGNARKLVASTQLLK
ncbi:hypothetical protein BC829DRAFT_439042 [Chytridium lagenaria]|nr:hypothetical protein BC829DRAFT_439042 [Chytridium lagenaria]